ncbi:MAG: twin-arginine translocase subunit TatC, partial [Proteobacteria bacterium]|nr:twin-arginine translocase subunit TatC [Pseudomonadota bacterium]
VGVFIVAAVITPPDPISQLSLALPIIVLYEISILMAKLVEKKRAKQDAEVEAEYGGGESDDDTSET